MDRCILGGILLAWCIWSAFLVHWIHTMHDGAYYTHSRKGFGAVLVANVVN